ncbi:histidine kinase N-terminal 7TM domain-containing protein [Peribacillus simplex]|uniref:Histidine kinase N-terminal 7TM domain-containing protein n=2 Tax=Peribacillus TaxID=2675229 RepID=A0AA90P1F1_9BACI|nr:MULTISPECIES: histidine kinase N-terminal 7TM domain-containing protein [Peribacillus]MDP1419115.1 histidine kinase N-terminal 7TM domain-containing protein [Peribacillus simplex]MDP1451808.1 histidine kinase N-terminal 7TM domain-containing protein [Peribacillus frigoritolerans]
MHSYRSRKHLEQPYILVTLLSAIYTFSYAFELSSTSLEQIIFWLKVEYLALPFIPVFLLLMCIEYVGQRIKKVWQNALFIIPFITIFMHYTTDLLSLILQINGIETIVLFQLLNWWAALGFTSLF